MARNVAPAHKLHKKKVLSNDPPTKEDRKIKPGGDYYTNVMDWEMPGQMGTLLAGGAFVECMDGCYQVVSKTGYNTWIRVGKNIVDALKLKEANELT